MAGEAGPPSHSPYGWIIPGVLTTCVTSPSTLPAGTTKTIFTVNGTGGIWVAAIWGVVTTVIQTQTCNTKLTATVTGLSGVDICGTGNISALAVGSLVMPITSFATALDVAPTNGVIYANPTGTGTGQATSFLMAGPGTIVVNTSATNTGAIQWYMAYYPIKNVTPTSIPATYLTSEVTPCNS